MPPNVEPGRPVCANSGHYAHHLHPKQRDRGPSFAKGRAKTGGRKKAAPNIRTVAAAQAYPDALKHLAKVMEATAESDPTITPDLKLRAAIALAQYQRPKPAPPPSPVASKLTSPDACNARCVVRGRSCSQLTGETPGAPMKALGRVARHHPAPARSPRAPHRLPCKASARASPIQERDRATGERLHLRHLAELPMAPDGVEEPKKRARIRRTEALRALDRMSPQRAPAPIWCQNRRLS